VKRLTLNSRKNSAGSWDQYTLDGSPADFDFIGCEIGGVRHRQRWR
jgi:hypothetical protein